MSWGFGPWGFTPWGFGGGAGGELRLLAATAVRENCVRLTFNQAVRLTNDLAPRDASHLRKYAFTANAATTGLDGKPARAVLPALVELARVAGAQGALVDVWTDRVLSPYPAEYSIAVTELYGLGGALLAPGGGFAVFFGLQAAIVPPVVDRVVIGADVANPISPAQLTDDRVPVVGSFVADQTGDYAIDQGIVSYKKRVIRRLFSRRGSFRHLPGYGVDVPGRVKQLARPSDQGTLVAEIEEQVKQEPETASVTAGLAPLGQGVWVLQLRASTTFGQTVELAERFVVGGA